MIEDQRTENKKTLDALNNLFLSVIIGIYTTVGSFMFYDILTLYYFNTLTLYHIKALKLWIRCG